MSALWTIRPSPSGAGSAALFAAALGAEREWRRHTAGFRTHILVSVGACLFTLLGAYSFGPGEP